MARVIAQASVRISSDVRDAEREAARAGERYGRAFAGGADRGAGRSNLAATLAAQVEQASARVAKAHDAEVAATTRVRLAETALDVLRASGRARAEQLAAAEERLASAKLKLLAAQDATDDSTHRLAQAQSALRGEMSRSEGATRRLSGALSRLRGDSDVDFSRLISGAARAAAALIAVGVAGAAMQALLGGGIIAVAGLGAGLVALSGLAAAIRAVLGGIGLAVGALKIGFSGFSDALKNIGDAEKFEESLKGLAPAAQEAARSIAGMKPAFDALRLDVQQRLFEGLAGPIRRVGDVYLPILRRELSAVAGAFNTVAKEIAAFLTAPKVVRDLGAAFQEIRSGTQSAIGAMQPLVRAFTDLFVVGAEFAPRFGQAIQSLAERFADFISHARDTGQIQQWIENGITAAKQFGSILGNIGSALGGISKAANTAAGGFLAALDNVTEEIARVINSVEGQTALVSFFTGVKNAINALKPVVGGVIAVLGALGPAFTGISQAVGPALGEILRALAEGLRNATPGLVALAQGFAGAIAAAAPFLPLLGSILGALAPILGPLGAVVALLATFGVVAKVIGSVVGIFSLASQGVGLLAGAWRLLSLAFAVSPIGFVITLLAGLVAALIYAWQNSETFRNIVTGAFQIVSDFISTVVTTVGGHLAAFVGFLTSVGETTRSVITAIIGFFTGLNTGVGNAVRFLVDTVIGFFVNLNASVSNTVRSMIDSVVGFFNNLSNSVSGTVRSLIDGVVNFFRNLPGQISGALGDLGNFMANIGIDIINGIGRGIQAGWSYLTGLVSNLASSLFNAAKAALGIGSPSKVFANVGRDTGLGVIQGVNQITPKVVASVRKMAESVTEAGQFDLGAVTLPAVVPMFSQIQAAVDAARELSATRSGQGVDAVDAQAREAVSIVQNIFNPTMENATDSSNRELRRFAAMGGFSR